MNGVSTDNVDRMPDMTPKPKLDAQGQPVPYHVSYPTADDKGNFLSLQPTAGLGGGRAWRVSWMFVQATVAILILVGFESVTAMGGEAKNAKRDVPIAVITSLLVQGAFCYLIEYFAANYFLNSGYTMQSALGSAAPIGDMMIVVEIRAARPGATDASSCCSRPSPCSWRSSARRSRASTPALA